MDLKNQNNNVAFGRSVFVQFPKGHSIPARYTDAIKLAKKKGIIPFNTPQKAIGTILSNGGCLIYDAREPEGKMLDMLSEKSSAFFNDNELKDAFSSAMDIIADDKNTVKLDYKA